MKLLRKAKVLVGLIYVLGGINTYTWRMYYPSQFVPPEGREADAQLAAVFWPLYVPWRIFAHYWIPVPAGTDTINYLDQ